MAACKIEYPDIRYFTAAKFEYGEYSNLAAPDPLLSTPLNTRRIEGLWFYKGGRVTIGVNL